MRACPRRLDLAAVVLGLSFGLVVGLWVGKAPPKTPEGAEPIVPGALAAASEAVEIGSGTDRVVQADLAAAPEPQIDYTAIFGRLEAAGFIIVPQKTLSRLQGLVVMYDASLAPAVSDLLQLEEEEVEQLNFTIRETRKMLETLQKKHARVEVRSQDEVVVRLSAFPEEGRVLQENLRRSFGAILGDRDGGLLWELMTRADDYWYRFGTEPIELTFYNGTPQYPAPIWLTIKPADPSKHFTGTSGSGSAATFQHIVPLLPGNMREVFSQPDPNGITPR